MMFFLINMLMLSIMFPYMKHPLSMGLILILQSMMTAIISGMMMNSFWFSYILFIILLGGALVLFIYMASVASNEKFYLSNNLMIMFIMMMFLNIIMMLLDTTNLNKLNISMFKPLIINEQLMNLTLLFNMQSLTTTMLLVIYLFITMIAISNIINSYEGPMRLKN